MNFYSPDPSKYKEKDDQRIYCVLANMYIKQLNGVTPDKFKYKLSYNEFKRDMKIAKIEENVRSKMAQR